MRLSDIGPSWAHAARRIAGRSSRCRHIACGQRSPLPARGGILTDMRRIKPALAGVDDDRADAFARWRILALRGAHRQRGFAPRLSLVTCDEISQTTHLPDDLAWWDPPTRRPNGIDAGLATEIAARLLSDTAGAPVVAVWTRSGTNDETDSDIAWWAALRQGAAIAEIPEPSLLVVTRAGWRCHPDGSSRTWRRLRPTA